MVARMQRSFSRRASLRSLVALLALLAVLGEGDNDSSDQARQLEQFTAGDGIVVPAPSAFQQKFCVLRSNQSCFGAAAHYDVPNAVRSDWPFANVSIPYTIPADADGSLNSRPAVGDFTGDNLPDLVVGVPPCEMCIILPNGTHLAAPTRLLFFRNIGAAGQPKYAADTSLTDMFNP